MATVSALEVFCNRLPGYGTIFLLDSSCEKIVAFGTRSQDLFFVGLLRGFLLKVIVPMPKGPLLYRSYNRNLGYFTPPSTRFHKQ